jgi:hypothetical protein
MRHKNRAVSSYTPARSNSAGLSNWNCQEKQFDTAQQSERAQMYRPATTATELKGKQSEVEETDGQASPILYIRKP